MEKILRDISDILPIHILVGNHDLWNKGTNDVNSVRIFSYISDNIHVYEKPTTLTFGDTKIGIIPWVEKRLDMIEEISKLNVDYLLCHSDLNGCKMHLNSVSHRNVDKIDVENFSKFKQVFSGHIHITQISKNFRFIGSLYQMDRNDIGDQKGITILDLATGGVQFEPNLLSPVFKKVYVREEGDIESLDLIKNTKDYIDLIISNKLLISNRKLRRKLEILLEDGNFSSVEYLDDLIKEAKDPKISSDESNEDDVISIQLDYEEYVKKYIQDQKYESDSIKSGVLSEFGEVVRIYNENYRSGI